MNNTKYYEALELERSGKIEEGFHLLEQLSSEGDPCALLDLSARYFSVEGFAFPVKQIVPDSKKSKELAIKAKSRLVELANIGDGEAMRMLASTYLGHWHPALEKSIKKAEEWLLLAYKAKCYFAANDLATFYQGINIEKAKFYYKEAERHDCRVIHNHNLEI
jgi:TPR repeat protein